VALTERLAALSDNLRATQSLMARLTEGQDGEPAKHLRNIDLTLQRLAQDLSATQAQTTNDLRQDLRLLTRTIAARAEERAP
jgi:response regulator RpfG family c-di-GMP phosphodiesterase